MITITLEPDSFVPSLISNNNSFQSNLNGFTQFSELPGSRWAASFTWTNRKGAEARQLTGQLASLNGRIGVFKIPIPDSEPFGTALGAGVVNGASQTGTELLTDGWDVSQTLLFAAGDWIEVDQQVFKITEDTSSDASGNATLKISPSIRRSPANNTPVVATPSFYMRSSKAEMPINVGENQVYAISLTGIEID